jgi:hypothetical protein
MTDHPPVRLKNADLISLISVFQKYFGSQDQLWVFGSRADLAKKGGDLDLYVETQESDRGRIFQLKLNFLVELKNRIGDQKIDLVIKLPDAEESLIFQEAREHGVRLL